MEYEIVDEIPEYSTANLHVSETEDVLNKKDELLTGNKSEKRTQSSSVEVVDVAGQVVPFHTCLTPEKEAKEDIDYLTVPRVKLNGLKESDQFTPEVKGVGLFSTSSLKQEENPPKTFLWPPIGLKEGNVTDQSAACQQDTFDQFVSNEDEEKDDDGRAIAEPEQVFNDPVSNHINQPEIHSLQDENHNLTSILKKDENGVKKTVHFPENIVSVKFYDLSDDEDSDNDTVILSDPEEDELRDQEVPFNTYSDYSTNCYLLSSTSVNFIPNFTFPPVLKINNCQLYEDIVIDDDDEQILAIMDDDDGRELSDANSLVADEIDSEGNMNNYKDDNLISTEMDKIPDHTSEDIEEKTKMTSKEIARRLKCEEENETKYRNPQQASIESANPEDTGKIIDLQLLVAKNGIEHLEDDLNIKFNATDKYCEVQVTAREVKKLSESSSEVYEAQKVSKLNEIERLVDSHKESVSDSQMAPVEIQSQSKFQEVSVPMTGSRDEHFEENFDDKMDEILQPENNDMARKGDASTFMKKIETVMFGDSKASVSSQKNVKLPHIYTLLDVLKASSSISEVQVKERCCETAEEHPFEDNLIEQEATCSDIVKRNTPPLTTMLPEISVFDSRQSEKVDKKLNVAQKSGMMQIRSVENKTVLKCEEPYIDKPAICDNYPTVIGANSVQLLIKNKKAPTKDVSKLPKESGVKNVELQAKDKTKPSTEIVIRKEDFAAEDKTKPGLVTEGGSFKESNHYDNSDGHMDVSLLTSGCTRTFHRNYGSKFLWRGPRSISTLILDEDFHVQAAPTADNDTPHQRPLIKEEITFPNFTVIDYRSLESMIPAAEWNNSKHYYEDSQLEKYPYSFMTSPDHVNEIEETWQSRIETYLSIRQQKVETYDYNTWLKQDSLKSEIGGSVKHSETEFDEHQRNRPYSATTFKHINPSDAPEGSEECVTPHRQPGNTYYPSPQIVPDMYVQCPLKAQPTTDSLRAVPSDGDNLIMDTTNTSLHLTEYPWQSPRKFGHCETVKDESYDKGSSYSPTPILARQGRRRLRVGLSKSTRVKPLHPYWSRERIKEKGSMS